MRAAIALLFIRCCFIKSFTFSATARLSAATCTSSCKPCFFRKLSKLLPRCLFLFLAAFDVGIFSSQSQSSAEENRSSYFQLESFRKGTDGNDANASKGLQFQEVIVAGNEKFAAICNSGCKNWIVFRIAQRR